MPKPAQPLSSSLGFRLVVVIFGVLMVGCQTDSDLGRFDQTWEEPVEEATCADWLDEMSGSQRFAAAAEWLLTARADAPGFPTDGQFTYYASQVTEACEAAGEEARASDVATEVYAELEGQLSQ